jgi:inhibitor of cysteine peptidase
MQQITETADRQAVVVRVGEEIELTLPENPSTGFSWQLSPNANAPYRLRREWFDATPGRVGAGGTRHWQLEATHVGQGTIALSYGRAWESATAPARTFTLHVTVVPVGAT